MSSTDRRSTRAIPPMSTETPPRSAAMWPSSEVPAPKGTIGTPCSAHARTRRAHSWPSGGGGTRGGGAGGGRRARVEGLVGAVRAADVLARDDGVGRERGGQRVREGGHGRLGEAA